MGYGMMGHMFGYGYGNTVNGWWLLGFGLLRVLLIVGVIVLVVKLVKKNKEHYTSSRPIEILKERYAIGEITEDEYKRKLKMLK